MSAKKTSRKAKKVDQRPFVVDMRHDETAPPAYAVCWTWEGAMRTAGAFWKKYDGIYTEKLKQPFLVEEGAEQGDTYVDMREGKYLDLQYANGNGPCIRIERAEIPEGLALMKEA